MYFSSIFFFYFSFDKLRLVYAQCTHISIGIQNEVRIIDICIEFQSWQYFQLNFETNTDPKHVFNEKDAHQYHSQHIDYAELFRNYLLFRFSKHSLISILSNRQNRTGAHFVMQSNKSRVYDFACSVIIIVFFFCFLLNMDCMAHKLS